MHKNINLAKAKEDRERTLKTFQMLDEIEKIEPKNLTELIFQQYIVLEGTTNTTYYLNENGYRTQGARELRKYISTDITDMLDDESNFDKVDERILFVALGLKKQIYNRFNWNMKLKRICDEYYEKFKSDEK